MIVVLPAHENCPELEIEVANDGSSINLNQFDNIDFLTLNDIHFIHQAMLEASKNNS